MNIFFNKNNNIQQQQQFSQQQSQPDSSKNNENQNGKGHDSSSDTKNDCCFFTHREFFDIDAYHLKIIERSLQSTIEYKQMKQKQAELRIVNKKATQLLKSLKQELDMKQSQIFELTKTNQSNVDQLILFKSLVQHGSVKISNSTNFLLAAPTNQIQTLSNVNFSNLQSSSSTASSATNNINISCVQENPQIQQNQLIQQQQQQLVYLANPNNGAQGSVFLINTSNFNNNQNNLPATIDYNQQIQLQANGQFNQNHVLSNDQQYIYINQNQINHQQQQQQQVCV